MLTIENLTVQVAQEETILNGLNLAVNAGEIHAIMGPNGSGKSTLSNVIAGNSEYKIQAGQITYQEDDLSALAPEARAAEGIFLSFQYPVSLPGVTTLSFLQAVINAQRKQQKQQPIDAIKLIPMAQAACKQVGLSESFLQRALNHEFSGGEKKRAELLQMLLLQPQLAILDETDSGLDIDALRMVGDVVNQMRDAQRAFIVVTHYHRILDHIQPDIVHVMRGGKIIKSGDLSLAKRLEKDGYGWIA